jgi:choline kinase
MTAMDGMAKGSISEFLLDSRTPSGTNLADQNYAEEEARREKETDRQVNELLKEVRIWRVANSAQWVAWGIVQAQVPDLDEPKAASPTGKENTPPNTLENAKADEVAEKKDDTAEHHDAEEEEFDYLAYAQDRAMFFWGDVVQLGIVKADELPESLRKSLRIVEY